jgi:hypothetical protein
MGPENTVLVCTHRVVTRPVLIRELNCGGTIGAKPISNPDARGAARDRIEFVQCQFIVALIYDLSP